MRRALACAAVLVLAGCGGGSLTLSDYASEAELLVATMEADFGTLDASWEAQSPSMERALEYWDGRLEIRSAFLEGVRGLDPPREAEGQHDMAIDIFSRITAADEALAARVRGQDTVSAHWAWVDTPEGRASDAILAEVYEFCRASQQEFDATQARGAFADLPWAPSAATETVSVAFGCPPS